MNYIPEKFDLAIKKAIAGWFEIGVKFEDELFNNEPMTTANTRIIIGEYIKYKYLKRIFTEEEIEECVCMDYNNGKIRYYLDDDEAEKLGLEEYDEDNYYKHPRYDLLVNMDCVPVEEDYNDCYEYEEARDKFYDDFNRLSIEKIEKKLIEKGLTTNYGLFTMLCHTCGLQTNIYSDNEDIFEKYSKRHIIKLQHGETSCGSTTPDIMGAEISLYDMFVGLKVLNKINDCYA